jgi:hypothetical protein
MSEKLYALLLRLYPSRFRRQYGEEALRVLRERLRDERGSAARLRLWLDLLLDFGSSLPREYRRAAPGLTAAQASTPGGMPLFQSLETELPRPGSFFGGTVLAFLAVAGLGFLLNHAGKVRVWATQYAAPKARASALPSSGTLPNGQGPGGQGSPSAGQSGAGHVAAGQSSAPLVSAGHASPPPPPQMVPAFRLDDAARHRILAAIDTTLRQSYANRHVAERIAFSLSDSEDRGGYETLPDAAAFADAITQQMRAVSGDSGLVLYFVATPLPKTPAAGDIYWIDPHFLLRVPLAQPAPGHTAPQV